MTDDPTRPTYAMTDNERRLSFVIDLEVRLALSKASLLALKDSYPPTLEYVHAALDQQIAAIVALEGEAALWKEDISHARTREQRTDSAQSR